MEFPDRRARGLVPDLRIEDCVSHILPDSTVNLVGAGLGSGVEHSAVAATELRAIVAGLELELLDSFWRGAAKLYPDPLVIVVVLFIVSLSTPSS